MEEIWAEILAQAEGESGGQNGDAGEGGDQNSQQKTGESNGTTQQDKKEEQKEKQKVGFDGCFTPQNMFLMLAMFAIMYFIMIRPQKKKQQAQQKMLQEVGKGTRIRTIGGIIGTIVSEHDDEVVIKIDETTNTKMRIVRSAIGKVLTEQEESTKKT